MTRGLVALALAKVALHLATAQRYGYAAEELYVLACSDRLDWGYIGLPPLTSAIALVGRIVLGSSLFGIRILPALAGGATVLLAGALVRRLGGGRFAALLAGLCAGFSPSFLAAHATLGPEAFAPLLWSATAFLVVRAEDRQRGVPLLAFTATLAAAVLVAPATGVFAAILVPVLLLTFSAARRGSLFALGGALLLLLPAIAWQGRHGWPVFAGLAFVPVGDVEPHLRALVAALHVSTLPIWLAGALGLVFAPGLGAGRAVGLALAALLGVVVAFGWSPAVVVPLAPVLFAAGAVVMESLARARGLAWLRPATAIGVGVVAAVCAPLVVPLLPLASLPAYAQRVAPVLHWPQPVPHAERLPEGFARMLGWPQLVAAARRGFDAVPRSDRGRTAVWARTRYAAAAIDRLGERHGLPRAISGDGNYRVWGADAAAFDGASLVVVGASTADLQPWFRNVRSIEVVECSPCSPERRRVEILLATEARVAPEELRQRLIAAGP